MTLDQLINVLVTVTLIEMMAAIGLGVTFGDLLGVVKNWGLVARAALANYIGVPAATVALLLLFNAPPMVAVGFLILAACPGAPFGPPLAVLARGNVAAAVGLMVILAGSSAVLAPVLLHYLTPLVAGNEPLTFDAVQIVITLLATQLAPLCAGVALRQWRPRLAERLQKPANSLSTLLNLCAVVLILYAHLPSLQEIRLRGFVGMLLLLFASWVIGWLFGGPEAATRRTMTLTTSLRNLGVGLVIVTGSFPGTAALTATLAYGLFEVFGSLLLAWFWAKHKAAPNRQNNGNVSGPSMGGQIHEDQ